MSEGGHGQARRWGGRQGPQAQALEYTVLQVEACTIAFDIKGPTSWRHDMQLRRSPASRLSCL